MAARPANSADADADAETDPTDATPTTMSAVVHRRYGTAEVLEIEEMAVPDPSAGQVLVRVEASSLNALDWHFMTGMPWLIRPTSGWLHPKRVVPGADVAGTVVALGPAVDGCASAMPSLASPPAAAARSTRWSHPVTSRRSPTGWTCGSRRPHLSPV